MRRSTYFLLRKIKVYFKFRSAIPDMMEVFLFDITNNFKRIWCHKVKEFFSNERQVLGEHKKVADKLPLKTLPTVQVHSLR
jgi:hypothetical protein